MNYGKITISRPSYSGEDKGISIKIKDSDARIEFLEVCIGLSEMMQALTGLGHVPCEFETRGLQNVGKVCETKPLVFEIGEPKWSVRDEVVLKKAKESCPDGWTPSLYFGSKDSFFSKDGKDYARTNMNRWVEKSLKEENK